MNTCLTSLFKLTEYPNFKVVIVYNGSTDGSLEFVNGNFSEVDSLRLEKNIGFTKACNRGLDYVIKKYDSEYTLLLNDDTEFVQNDWLNKLVESAEYDGKIAIVVPKLVYPNGKIQSAWTIINPKPFKFFIKNYGRGKTDGNEFTIIKEVAFLSIACALIKTNIFKTLGVLDENYAPGWLDDTDFCFRIKKAGLKAVYNGTAKVIHYESMSTTKRATENESLYYVHRKNMFYFLFKYFSLFDLLTQAIMLLIDSIFSITYFKLRNKFYSNFLLVLKALKEANCLKSRKNQAIMT